VNGERAPARDGTRFGARLAVCMALVSLGLALRLYRLETPELWLDEAGTFLSVNRSDWVSPAFSSITPPLFYLLLRPWILLLGDGEAELRLLSALLGTAFVAAAIAAGRELFSRQAGLWAGVLAAVSPIHVFYSRELRPYVLVSLCLMLASAVFWRARREDSLRAWSLFGGAVAAALLSHLYGALGVLVLCAAGLLDAAPRVRRRVAWAMLPGALLMALWVGLSLAVNPLVEEAADWMADHWTDLRATAALRSLEILGLGGPAPVLEVAKHYPAQAPAGLRALGAIVLAGLAAWFAVPAGEDRTDPTGLCRRKAGVAFAVLAPLLLLHAASLRKPVYVPGRHDIVALPPLVLALGFALAKLQAVPRFGPLLASSAALGLLLPIAARLLPYLSTVDPKLQSSTARVVLEAAAEGDVVVFTGLRGAAVQYQLGRLGYTCQNGRCSNPAGSHSFSLRFFPRETEETPAVLRVRRVSGSPQAVADDVEDFLDGLRGPSGSVHVFFGKFATSGGRLAVGPLDVTLLEALQRQGFSSVEGDSRLGRMTLRR
jgi:4-amino-4-deoxy-L-arabinose transferase-like glycosyltransferase